MLVIDRIEEGKAVCEDEDGRQVILDRMPKGASEGDVLVYSEEGQLTVDKQLTRIRREKAVTLSRRIHGRRRKENTT